MKKTSSFSLLKSCRLTLVLSFFFLNSIEQVALANNYTPYTEKWEITSFDSEIHLKKDGSFTVQENIYADFSNEPHRGILRIIPAVREGRNSYLKFIKGTDETGTKWKTETSRSNGNLEIKMLTHDDSKLSSSSSYQLHYSANNALNFFDNHDELYWNVTGNEWVVDIKSASAKIYLPEEMRNNINTEELQFDCFTGSLYSEEKNCQWEITAEYIEVFSTQNLPAYQGLTFVLGMPKGYIEKPSIQEQILWAITENKSALAVPFTFLFMLMLWWLKGRDAKTLQDTVIPHYTPPENLKPSQVGTLIDESLDPKDITATIIDFAVKGNIKIHERKKKGFLFDNTDYTLELVKPVLVAKAYEMEVINSIFPGTKKRRTIASLKNKFYKDLPAIRKKIINSLVEDGYFPHNPHRIKNIYRTIGLAVAIGTFYMADTLSIVTSISIITSGLIILAFHSIMPRKTKKGSETYYKLKGLYEYINTAEKDRLKFQEDASIFFEKLLPYAMAFGIADKWSKAFDDILSSPPSWYVPTGSFPDFSMRAFAETMDNFSTQTSSNLGSKPSGRSSGFDGGSGFSGGFSGGGFGGGGGRGL